MFSIRSKVRNAVATPIPIRSNSQIHEIRSSRTDTSSKLKSSRTKKRRKKKRKASEIVNINDYPSAKRRRISIVGVDVDPKKTKEIIQNKEFLLCEYHSNFPQFLVNQLKSIPKHELNDTVAMKSCDNQWIIAKLHPQSRAHEAPLLIYWNTSFTEHHNNHINNDNLTHNNHPNSPSKCYIIELNKCVIYDGRHVIDDISSQELLSCADMEHIHLLYPCASSLSTLKPHRAFKPSANDSQVPINKNKYNNPFMPYTSQDNKSLDGPTICPLFPSSTSRSMTSISAIVFLSSDHSHLYVIPHDHVTTISHETGSEHIAYGTNKNITYKIPLLTDTMNHNERITSTQILPQPRVGTHHSVNTYKILMGTTHGRLFYITLIINKNTVVSKSSDVYFDHGTDLSSKVIVRDHELLFAFSNENNDTSNNTQSDAVETRSNNANENVGWMGFLVSKIKIGANALSGTMDEDAQRIRILKESGRRFDINYGIRAIVFGLNETCTKVIGYTLRKRSIDCIEFREKDYKLLWSYSLQHHLDDKEEALSISLLGQGISVLSGFIDGGYGHAIIVRLFKINANINTAQPQPPLIFYGQLPIQLPAHIRVDDLYKLRYESFWSYYNDKKDGSKSKTDEDEADNDDDDGDFPRFSSLRALSRQTSMAEFVEQRQDLKNDIIEHQHHLVAPFGMLWMESAPFITLFPLLSMAKNDNDEIWQRLFSDYSDLYDGMQLNNTCGPDGDHFNNQLVSTFELRMNNNNNNNNNNDIVPFYGGGCMLLPYDFGISWKQKQVERNEDDEKQIVENATCDGSVDDAVNKRKEIRQLSGGGFGYFMNEKYQIMRIKYSLRSAMARIHPDIEHYQQQQREEESKKIKIMIRLAFSEFRNGNEGQPRANRLSLKLLTEQSNILSENVCKLSESILDLKLFDTFCASDAIQSDIQSLGFNTNKMRLGINQMLIKLQTYEDYIRFLKQSPSADDEGHNLWCSLHNPQQCDIIEHREYLEIARNLYNYFTNSKDDNDHYGIRDDSDEDEDDDDDIEDDDDEEEDIDEDEMDHNHSIDSRSSLGNFDSDSNHNKYRSKYFLLKKEFIPKLLQSIIAKRGDIEFIHMCGNDEYDTFFMKIAQIEEILSQLPTFLSLWLSHLTYDFFVCRDAAAERERERNSKEFNEDIALTMKKLAQRITIENERDELVHQLISIRIALELVQCVINTANEYRLQHKEGYREIFSKYNRTSWNYNNRIRSILMHICNIIVPFMTKIAPLLTARSSSGSLLLQTQLSVIDTDNNYYDYILNRERNEIYRNMNEMARIIMESYRKELHLLKHEYQDRTAYDALNKNFIRHRSYLVSHLYDLFPSGSGTNYDRWKTDLIKDAVNKIAYKYGDCEYLVKLCDPAQYKREHAATVSHTNILSICYKRFIENFKQYKYEFMQFYFQQHLHDIDAFLCLDIQQSDIWQTDSDVAQMKTLLDQCISKYINEYKSNNNLSIINEYSWIHNLSVAHYTNTAQQLYQDHNQHSHSQNLDDQTVHLSMAKLSTFVAEETQAQQEEDIEQRLMWLNAKVLLRSYNSSKYEDLCTSNISETQIVQHLIRESLLIVSKKQRAEILQQIEEILSLIFNLSTDNDLDDDELIVVFIQHVIDYNVHEWQLLDDMYDKDARVIDNSMLQIINRTLVYQITKYLYDKKKQSQFINQHNAESNTHQQEHELWELWSNAINYSTTNKTHPKYYFTVRALSFAQSPSTL